MPPVGVALRLIGVLPVFKTGGKELKVMVGCTARLLIVINFVATILSHNPCLITSWYVPEFAVLTFAIMG